MARQQLSAREGREVRVRAKIERYGKAPSTYLLTSVCDAESGELLTDHLWIEIGPWASGCRIGDEIELVALVESYIKGWLGDPLRVPDYVGGPSIDWGLSKVIEASITKFGPIVRMMDDGTIQGG